MAFKPKKDREESGAYRKPLIEMTLAEIRERIKQEIEAAEWNGSSGAHLRCILTLSIDELRARKKACKGKGKDALYENLGVMRNGAALMPDGYNGLFGMEAVDLRLAEMQRIDYAAEKQYGDMPEARKALAGSKTI